MEFLGSLLRSMSFRDENSGASRNVSCFLTLLESSLFNRANQGTARFRVVYILGVMLLVETWYCESQE